MTGDMFGQLAYLVLLGVAIIGWFVAQNRASLGKNAQYAAVWGLIFMGVIAVAGLWSDIRRTTFELPRVSEDGTISISRSGDGHFHLLAAVNDVAIDFIVDTGATNIVLSREDAAKVGIDPLNLSYVGTASTANGETRIAQVRLDSLAIGPVRDTRVRAYVTQGDLFGSLLGMDYLNRFSQMTIAGDQLILHR